MTSYVQGGGRDVISRRKVLPSGECRRSVCPAHMQQCPSFHAEKCYHLVTAHPAHAAASIIFTTKALLSGEY